MNEVKLPEGWLMETIVSAQSQIAELPEWATGKPSSTQEKLDKLVAAVKNLLAGVYTDDDVLNRFITTDVRSDAILRLFATLGEINGG